ncbi:MAG TPA: ATP synthase F0 subunit C [Vicinamibacterales bacterium]|nr:ATP synthase F0 subunit C [Vicinamibacterales bacterium]
MSKRSFLLMTFVFLALGAVVPLHAQEAAGAAAGAAAAGHAELIKWSIIAAGFPLGLAAAFGAIGQGMSISGAVQSIARNPSAAGEIRGNLILGLVLIESLVIYVLLISLILFFVHPFGA